MNYFNFTWIILFPLVTAKWWTENLNFQKRKSSCICKSFYHAEEGTWTLTSVTLTRTWILLVCQFRHFRKPYEFILQSSYYSACGRWDLNPHDLTVTRSLVLLVCQFRHFRKPLSVFVSVVSATQQKILYHCDSHLSTLFSTFFIFKLKHFGWVRKKGLEPSRA